MDYDDWRSAHGVAEPSTLSVKLGDKLKKTLEELEQARIKGIEAQAAADMEAIRRARADLEDWLEHVRVDLVAQIERGKVPLKKLKIMVVKSGFVLLTEDMLLTTTCGLNLKTFGLKKV